MSHEQRRKSAIAELQALIDEGIASGVSALSVDEIFEDAVTEFEAREFIDANSSPGANHSIGLDWRAENKAAIEAYNKRVGEFGTLIKPVWLKG